MTLANIIFSTLPLTLHIVPLPLSPLSLMRHLIICSREGRTQKISETTKESIEFLDKVLFKCLIYFCVFYFAKHKPCTYQATN